MVVLSNLLEVITSLSSGTDGKVRTCRIRGKIKRRMWIRDNDLVPVAPWDFQSDKADIVWRYISAHADKLEQEGHLVGLQK